MAKLRTHSPAGERQFSIARHARSLDHLISAGEDRRRDRQAERLCGVEIDNQLEPRRLLDRQIARLGALEDLPGVNADLAIDTGDAGPIADQAAGRSKLTPLIDRRHGTTRRQRHELLAPAEEERVGANEERPGMQLGWSGEGGVDLTFGAGLQDLELYPLRA